jgi:hypothetical protein
MRVADAHGRCICLPSSVEIFGTCYPYVIVLATVLLPVILLGLVVVYMYVEHQRKEADAIWLIKTSELRFDDPPEILGRGTFGLVVRAEYRGTQVAVKRVIPPRKRFWILRRALSGTKTTLQLQRQRQVGNSKIIADKDHYFQLDLRNDGNRQPRGLSQRRLSSNLVGPVDA